MEQLFGILPPDEAPKRAVSRKVCMSPNPANEKTYLGSETGVRRAAMLVIDDLGEAAAEYAAARAMVLQRRGDVQEVRLFAPSAAIEAARRAT
jgi:hypothetical protein